MRVVGLVLTYVMLIFFFVPITVFTLWNMMHIKFELYWQLPYFPYLFTVLLCPFAILVCSILNIILSRGGYKIIGWMILAFIVLWFGYFISRVNGNF